MKDIYGIGVVGIGYGASGGDCEKHGNVPLIDFGENTSDKDHVKGGFCAVCIKELLSPKLKWLKNNAR